MVYFGWKATGPVCKVHARACFFLWVPVLVQEELFEYLDTVVSVSGLGEGEGS